MPGLIFATLFEDSLRRLLISTPITLYATGTNVLATVWLDAAGTLPAPNPRTTDAYGNLPATYADTETVDAMVNGGRVTLGVNLPTLVADGTITTAKIAAGAVTVPKLSFDPATQAELDANIAAQAATYVPKSLYDPNTVLAATADNTPAALTMAASTILARLATGTIVAATPGQLRTLLGLGSGRPLSSPARPGALYNGNGQAATGTRTTGTVLNLLTAGLALHSGAGFTIDYVTSEIVTAGAAGAVYRIGVWLVDNTDDPFAFVAGSQYGSLLSDFGTVDATTTGLKSITPGTPVAVPAGRWFVLGGVSQVAVSQPIVAVGGPAFSPTGQGNAVNSLVSAGANWCTQSGVVGAFGALIPTSVSHIGHAVGFRRGT